MKSWFDETHWFVTAELPAKVTQAQWAKVESAIKSHAKSKGVMLPVFPKLASAKKVSTGTPS